MCRSSNRLLSLLARWWRFWLPARSTSLSTRDTDEHTLGRLWRGMTAHRRRAVQADPGRGRQGRAPEPGLLEAIKLGTVDPAEFQRFLASTLESSPVLAYLHQCDPDAINESLFSAYRIAVGLAPSPGRGLPESEDLEDSRGLKVSVLEVGGNDKWRAVGREIIARRIRRIRQPRQDLEEVDHDVSSGSPRVRRADPAREADYPVTEEDLAIRELRIDADDFSAFDVGELPPEHRHFVAKLLLHHRAPLEEAYRINPKTVLEQLKGIVKLGGGSSV